MKKIHRQTSAARSSKTAFLEIPHYNPTAIGQRFPKNAF